MKKLILLLIAIGLFETNFGQVTRNNDVVIGGSTSAAGSGPVSTQRYQRVAYLVAASELSAAGITNGTNINSIGFLYCGLSDMSATGTFRVWLQNTADVTYSKSTTIGFEAAGGVTEGMTLVRDANITLNTTDVAVDFPFTGGATSNFAYTGGNLYVAYEYTNVAGTLPNTANNVYCNNSTTPTGAANGLRRSSSTTAMPTTAASSSAFRPFTRFGYTNLTGTGVTNDATVLAVYTLGTLPVPSTNNHVIQAMVKNNGDNTLTNLNVTLNISGANTFSDTKQIASLGAGNLALVTFNGFSATTAGNNTVTVSVPADAVPSNDAKTFTQIASGNTYSTMYGTTINSSTSATAATEHLTKFNTTTAITIDQVTSFFNAAGAPYTVTIRDASGPNGLPGAVPLWESSAQTTVTGGVANNVSVSPAINFSNVTTGGNFYIGIRQTGTTSIALMTQQNEEVPMRQNTYYTSSSAVGALTAFSSTGFNKYAVEARYSSALPVSLVNFSGTKSGVANKLFWTTANEQNNKGFELQRSADGINFSTLNFIPTQAANGNSNRELTYGFTDEQTLKGSNYYRLRQVDTDGRASISNIVLIRGVSVKNVDINNVYPNPAIDKLNVAISVESNRKVDFVITDLSGKIVMQQSQQVPTGDSNIQLQVGRLAAGSYILKAVCDNGCESAVQKFVKQ